MRVKNPPRHPNDGKLTRTYQVRCCECRAEMLGLAQYITLAERELTRAGWQKARGFWTCSRCVEN